jgi:hypothetical protein
MKLQPIAAMRWVARLVGLLIVVLPAVAYAQPWSGIIAPSRATDWRGVGAIIPPRTTICASIAPYTGSAAAINTAISACPSGQVVQLGSGTFTLSSGISLSKSNVTLRGMGAGSTKLVINGTVSGCHLGLNSAIRMCTGGGNIGVDSPEHTATWTAGYAKGTTVITLSNTTGLVAGPLGVGSTIWLDQANDAVDGWPATGDIFQCSEQSGCSNQGGGEYYARGGRGQTEGQLVTAINGNQVTISPGLRMPNWRSSQNPGAWWGNASTVIQNTGLEDMTVDFTSTGVAGLMIINATNCWTKGMRWLKMNATGTEMYHVFLLNAFQVTNRDSYFWGPTVQANAQYAYAQHITSGSLFENNIMHHNVSPIIPNSPSFGNVIAYNYVDDSYYTGPGVIEHGMASMNLYEGNNAANFSSDIIHAPHHFETLFRNHHDGRAHNPQNLETNAGVSLYSKSRFFNIIGNVIGHSHWTSYQTLQAHNGDAIYEFGWQGTGSGNAVSNDSNVNRTVMRWGNWDSVNNATRFVASEVPSGITNFPNPVPASQTLPPSFYLLVQPPWWSTAFGTPSWPAIGPDVAGGNISNSPTGGHASKIPARLCFENTPLDPGYPSSAPRVRLFNASTCYAQPTGPAPSAPGTPILQ